MLSRERRGLLLLLLATALLYLPTLSAEFVGFDDEDYVKANPDVQQPDVRRIFDLRHTTLADWTPVVTLSYALEYRLFGLDARAYHATNLLLHLACVVLMYFFLRDLEVSASLALLGALWSLPFTRSRSSRSPGCRRARTCWPCSSGWRSAASFSQPGRCPRRCSCSWLSAARAPPWCFRSGRQCCGSAALARCRDAQGLCGSPHLVPLPLRRGLLSIRSQALVIAPSAASSMTSERASDRSSAASSRPSFDSSSCRTICPCTTRGRSGTGATRASSPAGPSVIAVAR